RHPADPRRNFQFPAGSWHLDAAAGALVAGARPAISTGPSELAQPAYPAAVDQLAPPAEGEARLAAAVLTARVGAEGGSDLVVRSFLVMLRLLVRAALDAAIAVAVVEG